MNVKVALQLGFYSLLPQMQKLNTRVTTENQKVCGYLCQNQASLWLVLAMATLFSEAIFETDPL
jgi:hypothetical protein